MKQMYGMMKGEHNQWGLKNYTVLKNYLDPNKIVKEREYLTQKKGTIVILGQKPSIKPTKKGSFLDPLIDKKAPKPVQYNLAKLWPESKPNVKDARKQTATKRNTYIDLIFNKKLKVKL